MANYPALVQVKGTSVNSLVSTKYDRAVNGQPRGLVLPDLSQGSFYKIAVKHQDLTAAEKEQIIDHYKNHISLEFLYYYGNDALYEYTCTYSAPPAFKWQFGDVWNMTCSLHGFKTVGAP